MNYLRVIGAAVAAATTILAITAGTASATTLEISGVAQNQAVTIEASATEAIVLAKTDGSEDISCAESHLNTTTSVFSGTKVTGALSQLTFKKCSRESVVVDAAGQWLIEHEAGTTKGKVFWENFQITVPTSFGFSVTCTAVSPIVVAILVAGFFVIEGFLNCGVFLPSATIKGSYKVSSPTALGVVG
jgi:hypothetical protein